MCCSFSRIVITATGLFLFNALAAFGQGLVLNELMSSNSATLADADGSYPDWIELYNSGSERVDLAGYGLSDDTTNVRKWTFPAMSIDPGQYLLVFASGSNDTAISNHWETIVDQGDSCRYKIIDQNQAGDWVLPEFDDHAWQPGRNGIGYGDDDDFTVISQALTVYVRHTFSVENLPAVRRIFLHVDYDDAFVAYLNGVEVARANIGQPGVRPAFDEPTVVDHEAQMYSGGQPDVFDLQNFPDLLREGTNVLAVEVHNRSIYSSDLTIKSFLTLGLTAAPPDARGYNPALKFPDQFLHTNFKLRSSGETLLLTDPAGQMVDYLFTDSIPADISRGRQPDGSGDWYFFKNPTPGKPNGTDGFLEYAPQVNFSLPPGKYNSAQMVTLSTGNPADTIYYTLDGSIPNTSSPRYQQAIVLWKTTVLKARTLRHNALPGPVRCSSYFINEEVHLPVLSLSTDPDNLWDDNIGIYVLGPNAEPDIPHFGANFWQDWERPVHIEFFEEDGSQGFSVDCGMKIYGAWSRDFAQKSFALFFRSIYGTASLNYPVFPDQDVHSFEALVLRNSGNDWEQAFIRDPMIQTLAGDLDIDTQAYRPVVVYFNGQYWGIHNLREKLNEHYIASHYGVDPDEIDYLENNADVIRGDNAHYQAFMDYLAQNDISTSQALQHIEAQIDLDSYLDYVITEIYCDNTDWPGNNVKFWRPRSSTGRWRWILFDTDFGFGLYRQDIFLNNTMTFATDPNSGVYWPNPPWSTFLLRKILENPAIRERFISRLADMLNTTFNERHVKDHITAIIDRLRAEMPRHLQRWERSPDDWQWQVDRIYTFARNRPTWLRKYVSQYFNLAGTSLLTLDVSDSSAGTIVLNTLQLDQFPWQGQYFRGIPVRLRAVPHPGFRFSGWTGSLDTTSANLELLLSDWIKLQAHFTPLEQGTDLVINEINYKSAADFDSGDWIELLNNGDQPVNCSGWIIKDNDDAHQFVVPAGTVIAPDSFLVIVRDTVRFDAFFTIREKRIGNMGFGLKGSGDMVRLFDAAQNLIDSVRFDDNAPWPPEADGQGATLELIHPDLDNGLAASWKASPGHGTPGVRNASYTTIEGSGEARLPAAFRLDQNYPNPFNPRTVIRYALPQACQVEISVFDVRGQKISTLVSRFESAGEHRIIWEPAAEQIASGVYFYRLQVNRQFSQTRKMILIH